MKVECVLEEPTHKSDGITESFVYTATPVIIGDELLFLLFNDLQQWKHYPVDYFIPARDY